MEVVATSPDPVRISFMAALLRDAGIASTVFDSHISAVEGGIGAFPRRLAVAPEDAASARRVLSDAGEVPEK
jgi:Putative prokaryotic signal transducing protein